MAKPLFQRATLKDEQMAEFIKVSFEIMDDLQLAKFGERWELVCFQRQWPLLALTEPLVAAAAASSARR